GVGRLTYRQVPPSGRIAPRTAPPVAHRRAGPFAVPPGRLRPTAHPWPTVVSVSTGASSRSTAPTVTRTSPSARHILIRSVSPGYTTPANRVAQERTRVTSPSSSVSTTALRVIP